MAEREIRIYIGATSLRTSLGNKTATVAAMSRGESGLHFSDRYGMSVGELDVDMRDGYTRFESLVIEQVTAIGQMSEVDFADEDTLLIISTTKGNIELLAECEDNPNEKTFLGASALRVAEHCGCANKPCVISNACISGVSAFVVARDMMLAGRYRNVVVVGCDVLSEFITEGFASFKSISASTCLPYDARRDGLTLGEACGAVLLTTEERYASTPYIYLTGGAVTNDANHISGPARTGDGLYYAIEEAMSQAGVSSVDVGFVNTHGTATEYNDEMESKALAWAELCDVPTNSLKGYIGHTLGASGVVELALCVEELRQGYIFSTAGFNTLGTPHRVGVSAANQTIGKRCCLKTASGFGGCNAAVLLDMECRSIGAGAVCNREIKVSEAARYVLPQSELLFSEYIRREFKSLGEPNMKFYKMSDMCKALYVAVERLLAQVGGWKDVEPRRRAIVLANRSASLDADMIHQQIVNRHLPEGASPAAFVYTLPNVAAGEICIKHKIQGNNTFFVEEAESGIAGRYASRLIATDRADSVICGWCDYLSGQWSVDIRLLKKS